MPIDYFQYFFDKLIKKYSIDRGDMDRQFNEWVLKFGETDKSKSDFIWSIMQSVALQIAKKYPNEDKMYQNLRKIYCCMFEFLVKNNKNAAHINKLICYCDLMRGRSTEFYNYAVIIGMKDCNEAKKYDGQQIPIEDAIKLQLIPFKDCKRKLGCVCCYGIKAKRDSEGHLIWKEGSSLNLYLKEKKV